MNNITEVLIVTCIVGILVIVTGFTFHGWIGKYRTEGYILELYSDVMAARVESSRKNRRHFLHFPSQEAYEMYRDDGDNNLDASEDTLLDQFPKKLRTPYKFTLGASSAPTFTLNFDRNGMSSALRTFCIFTDFDEDGVSDSDPNYDCMIVHWTRVNRGKLRKQDTAGGKCDSENCQAL